MTPHYNPSECPVCGGRRPFHASPCRVLGGALQPAATGGSTQLPRCVDCGRPMPSSRCVLRDCFSTWGQSVQNKPSAASDEKLSTDGSDPRRSCAASHPERDCERFGCPPYGIYAPTDSDHRPLSVHAPSCARWWEAKGGKPYPCDCGYETAQSDQPSVETACTHDGSLHTWREGCPS